MVYEIEYNRSGNRSRTALHSVDLPAPEGAERIKRRPGLAGTPEAASARTFFDCRLRIVNQEGSFNVSYRWEMVSAWMAERTTWLLSMIIMERVRRP